MTYVTKHMYGLVFDFEYLLYLYSDLLFLCACSLECMNIMKKKLRSRVVGVSTFIS